ncbi:hypothetical protein KKA17_00400 [bacterium]|nr:hypothetical protein [bacterium]MBU1882748.1 hypothetical protein [bacterium]
MIVIHFLLSVIYVVLFTISFILFYFYLAKLMVWLFNFIRTIPRLLLDFLNAEFKELKNRFKAIPTLQWRLKSIWIKRIFLFFLVLNVSIYVQQLIYWNGKGSTHSSAKCYYASGNVIATYRSFFASMLTPHNLFTFWLEIPQRVIYNTAKPLIPEEDGEIALWGYHWFVYPYAKRFYIPTSLIESDWNPLFRKHGSIPTYTWEFIKAAQKDNFKDKKMRDEHALRNLPLAALYLDELYNHERVYPTMFVTKEAEEEIAKKEIEYSSWQQMKISSSHSTDERRAYFKKAFDRLWMVNQKSFYICTTAYKGLKSLEQKWQESEFMSQEVEKHPSLEATRKAAMIAMLQGGALDFKFDKEDISCTDPDVLDYIKLRKELVAMDTGNQLIHNLANRYISADYFKYLFDTYCDYNLTAGFNTGFGTDKLIYENWSKDDREVLLKSTTTLGE